MRVLALVAAAGLGAVAQPVHPLTPLSAREIRAASKILRDSGRLPRGAEFSVLTLDEPPKEAVLHATSVPRRAYAVIYDRAGNRTWEAVADLGSARVDSWKEIPGAQPPITGEDSELAERIVRGDPRWARAMRERRIRD
jgi:primary-amine oxidase